MEAHVSGRCMCGLSISGPHFRFCLCRSFVVKESSPGSALVKGFSPREQRQFGHEVNYAQHSQVLSCARSQGPSRSWLLDREGEQYPESSLVLALT